MTPRPLVLDIARSAFDVQYALKYQLLVLYEVDVKDGPRVVDTSQLAEVDSSDATYIVLSSVGRPGKRTEPFTTYMSPVNPKNGLASLLGPGKKYTVQFASRDLGVKWHAYGEYDKLVLGNGNRLQPTGQQQLVRAKSKFPAGHVKLTVVSSLP